MAKSLQIIRTRIRTNLDELTPADWSDSQIDTEINAKYMAVYTAVVETFEDYYRKRVKTDVMDGKQEYLVPNDFFKMKRLEITYQSSEIAVKAFRQDFDQITRSNTDTSIGSTSRPIYELSGKYIKLLPIPQNTVSNGLLMTYIREIPELVENTDEIDIPFANRYWLLIATGAAGELLRKGQQEETVATRYLQEFELQLEKMQRELEERYLDGSKQILDTVQDNVDFGSPLYI